MEKNLKVFTKLRHTNTTIGFSVMVVAAVVLLFASGPIVESQHAMANFPRIPGAYKIEHPANAPFIVLHPPCRGVLCNDENPVPVPP